MAMMPGRVALLAALVSVAVVTTQDTEDAIGGVGSGEINNLDPDYQFNYSRWSTSLRSSLLSGYDRRAPPESVRTGNESSMSGPSRAGTDVKLQIRFFKVKEVNLVAGFMTLKVWWRLSWTDLRLAWKPAAHHGVTQVPLEQTEVWLPDLGHYNAMAGVQTTLEPSVVVAQHDGSLYWSRPGTRPNMT
jgi:hypothetical protein